MKSCHASSHIAIKSIFALEVGMYTVAICDLLVDVNKLK